MWILLTLLLLNAVKEGMAYSVSDVANVRVGVFSSYDALVLPAETVNVSIALHLVQIVDLDVSGQTMEFTGHLSVTWFDARLSWLTYPDIKTIYLADGAAWRPDLVITNQVDSPEVLRNENLRLKATHTGILSWHLPVHAKVHCALDATYFPFDKHRCGITVSSWTYDVSETPLWPLGDGVYLDEYQKSAEWDVEEVAEVEMSQMNVNVSTLDQTYSLLTFYVTLTRRSWMYGLSFILPLVLVAALSILVFVLPTESGEKASYIITVFLTLVVLYSIAFLYFPVSVGVTVLVIYSAFVMILIALEVLCVFVVLYLYNKHDRMSPRTTAVLNILQKITCSSSHMEDTKSTGMSEETASTRISEHDLHATVSGLPNGGIIGKKHGILSPIHRQVVPSQPQTDSLQRMSITEDNLESDESPGSTTNQSAPQSKTGLQKHINTREVTPQVDYKQAQNCQLWKELSRYFDRLFLVVFLFSHFVLHFVCLILLGAGGN